MDKRYWPIIVGALLLAAAGLFSGTGLAAPDLDCRFGITAPYGYSGYEYELRELRACSLLTWSANRPSGLPEYVEFVHMLRTRDDLYPGVLSNLSSFLSTYPGAIWAVGNEPDTCYENQDCKSPEDYAARYYTIASQIRSEDPTATILFGNIVQPTELRLRYLERAWEELISLAGGESAAADLIDVWSIHSFILNEWPVEPNNWGTGVPLGFNCETADEGSAYYGKCWDAGDPPDPCTADTCWDIVNYDTYPFPETHDNSIFNARIEDMRQWMLDHGERDKPLWITEYGSLFPPEDPDGGPDLVNVSDAETASFMSSTFDYLRTTTDASTGYAADGNRLVQRWFWYSLNEHRYVFGGTLYDPDDGQARTAVGDAWVSYLGDIPYQTFDDVPTDYWAYDWIEALFTSGITGGCMQDPLSYCPGDSVTRAQMAVFLERGMRGADYSPPAASGTIFNDVSAGHWAAAWIEQLYADGITTGCSTDPAMYCPEDPVKRSEMAVFLERAMHWPSAYAPPAGAGTVFGDVSASYWAVDWIEQLYADAITSGCSSDPLIYCPEDPVLRSEMAVFLVRTFGLPVP